MHMFMKWTAISGSQTPRVLQVLRRAVSESVGTWSWIRWVPHWWNNKTINSLKCCNSTFHMFHYFCCNFELATFLPCCHVSRYEKLMLHSHVALLPFTSKSSMKQIELRMLHMYVSVTMTWWDRWCTCLWIEMQFCRSQTPRVLQLQLQSTLRTSHP